jgi:serine/threonine-protein kinase RsbW
VTEKTTTAAATAANSPAAPGLGREAADQVTVRMPAEGAYLSVLRTATAGLAARLDFTLDEIEDLRIAVDEACAMLLNQAIPGSDLECSFALGRDTFAWTVLSALAGSVDSFTGPGDQLTIVMQKSRLSGSA